jgi:hypothetical protein
MPISTVRIPCSFVEDFKVGETLVLTARVLCIFVEANGEGVFNKLIVMQVGSMVEAALAEIVSRLAQNYNCEGVPNISQEELAAIRKGMIGRFESIIDLLRKRKILDDLGGDIYDELNKLKEYWIKVSLNESSALLDDVRNWVLGFNVRVLTHLSDRFPRPEDPDQHVAVLTIPIRQEHPTTIVVSEGDADPI